MTDAHVFACLDTTARLAVWSVTASLADPLAAGVRTGLPPSHVPAYTAEEAVQAAAAVSGIDRNEWNRHLWTATRKGTEP